MRCDRNGLLIDSNISINKYPPNERGGSFNCWTVVHFHIIISNFFYRSHSSYLFELFCIWVCLFVSFSCYWRKMLIRERNSRPKQKNQLMRLSSFRFECIVSYEHGANWYFYFYCTIFNRQTVKLHSMVHHVVLFKQFHFNFLFLSAICIIEFCFSKEIKIKDKKTKT